jgi:hypothetical protein
MGHFSKVLLVLVLAVVLICVLAAGVIVYLLAKVLKGIPMWALDVALLVLLVSLFIPGCHR